MLTVDSPGPPATAVVAGAASLLWSVAIGFVLWLPPLIDQFVHDPGNIRMLQQHFMNPPEESIGGVAGLKLLLRHLDLIPALRWDAGGFVSAASEEGRSMAGRRRAAGGVGRLGRPRLAAAPSGTAVLHATIGAVLVLEAMSMARSSARSGTTSRCGRGASRC